MKQMNLAVLTVLIIALFTFQTGRLVDAKPLRSKRSGISDQRVAELETIIALTNMRNRLRNSQVAYGLIDPEKIGKRKRSYVSNTNDDDERRRLLGDDYLQRILKISRENDEDYASRLDEIR
ncbi:hypothetical protein CHUAL_008443 [Chamberlinius hualienensis]